MDPEKQNDIECPEKDFKKSLFTFSGNEMMELAPYNSAMAIGQMAEILSNQIVNTKVLPRLGVKVTADSKLFYDIPNNKIITWIPKRVCVNCKNKKAEFDLGGKDVCAACVDILKTTSVAPKVEKPKKK